MWRGVGCVVREGGLHRVGGCWGIEVAARFHLAAYPHIHIHVQSQPLLRDSRCGTPHTHTHTHTHIYIYIHNPSSH